MEIVTLTEGKRKCGYRKAGGMYLMGEGIFEPCERLPMPLHICPTCGQGIKFSRGFTWVTPSELFAEDIEPICVATLASYPGDRGSYPREDAHRHTICPMCSPPIDKHGLLWIGKRHYSPAEFKEEARRVGISRAIPSVPRGFKFGVHRVYLAHLQAVLSFGEKPGPGIFMVFKPTHIDLVIDDPDDIPGKVKNLKEKHGKFARIVKVIPEPEPEQLELKTN